MEASNITAARQMGTADTRQINTNLICRPLEIRSSGRWPSRGVTLRLEAGRDHTRSKLGVNYHCQLEPDTMINNMAATLTFKVSGINPQGPNLASISFEVTSTIEGGANQNFPGIALSFPIDVGKEFELGDTYSLQIAPKAEGQH